MKSKNIVHAALLCSILCVLSPISIPIGPVPITLATFMIYIIGAVSDIKTSIISVVLYIILGCLGLPIFSGFCGGIGQIIGPTGGYIVGYIPLVTCVGLFNKNRLTHAVSMVIGTIILYIIGSIWFITVTKSDILTAVSVCILPFLAGDIVKITLVVLLIPRIRQIIKKI